MTFPKPRIQCILTFPKLIDSIDDIMQIGPAEYKVARSLDALVKYRCGHG